MLDTYPDTFTVVQIHQSDVYNVPWGDARSNFYTDFDAFPTSYQDGILRRRGAYGASTYLNDYLSRQAVPTDVTIDILAANQGGTTYDFTARVCIESGGTAKTMRINMVETLDAWPTTSSGYRHGLRQGANYQDVTLNPGDCAQVTNTFTFDSTSWSHPDDIYIVAWAQEPQATSPPTDRAEVYQAATSQYPFLSDCNQNGIPDQCDLDCGTPGGYCDVTGCGQSDDCNANGMPDDCEPDCNLNGIADECDITSGYSLDCQINGIPDECELTGNDCNSNLVPDDCDIGSGFSTDCNTNGIPDECEPDCNNNGWADECDIMFGVSLDCQPDGVPDECQLDGNDCNANTVPDECDLAPHATAVSFPLDSDPGWAVEGLWAFGQPTGGGSYNGDPTSGFTGPYVFGYNLDGDYENDLPGPLHVTTDAINCADMTGVSLSFRRYLGVHQLDRATIDVSTDGVNWTNVYTNPTFFPINDSGWSLQTFDISAVADAEPTVYVRWGMGPTDATYSFCGWNLDDVEIAGYTSDSFDVNGNGTPDECDAMAGGDFDVDGDTDIDDFLYFQACLAGPGGVPAGDVPGFAAACMAAFDFNVDGSVDMADFVDFQTVFTAP